MCLKKSKKVTKKNPGTFLRSMIKDLLCLSYNFLYKYILPTVLYHRENMKRG